MSIENIQIVADVSIETDDDGKRDILLTINSDDLVFDKDNVCITVIMNGVVLGYWR